MSDVLQTGSTPPDAPQGPIFRRLFAMLRPQRAWIVLAVVLLIASIPCELFPAFIWQYVTDDLILKGISPPTGLNPLISFGGRVAGIFHLLLSSIGWLIAIYVAGELLGTVSTFILQKAAQKFVYLLRNKVYARLQGQSLGYLQLQRTGDLMSRAMGDVDEIQSLVVNSIDQVIGDGLLWLAVVGVVLWQNWLVAGASLIPLVIVFLMLLVFNKRVKPIYAAARQRAGDVSNRLQENLSGVTVIKIFSREKEEAARFERATWEYYVQQVKAIVARNLYFPLARAVGFFSNVFMVAVGGFLLLRNRSGQVQFAVPHLLRWLVHGNAAVLLPGFTVGTFLMFRAYWWRLLGPIQTLARVNDMVQRGGAAAKRVFEVLDAPEELPDAPDAVAVSDIAGHMGLENVTFRYPGEAGTKLPVVLDSVDLRIEPGQTVALCGPSGSGKSTVLNLLLRFYDPSDGRVVLDGRDLRSIRRDSFRGHFALVQQETFLFNDSVLDNIRYGHGEATMEQVIAAAKAANAHGFISQLPRGYDTKVGERGVRLSGGQKQRISIARAFLADPKVLLLDEPTSSVEPDSEAAIIAALDRLMAGRTTVLTSHRPSLINQAGLVYVIEGGKVSESGSPSELIRQGGWFARFIRTAEDAMGEPDQFVASDEK
ncbi:MAG: ABC transporter ATP-binding protein [Tepidisphaeraceae bacterium]